MDIIKSMQIFKEVVEENSFSRAAENLNLVPSAVSRQVSELENWMGVRLINRTTRSLHITSDGRNFLEKMTSILREIDHLKSLQEEKTHLSGRIKITAPVMLGQNDIAPILSKFKYEHPDVQISLTIMNRYVDIVEEGYDLAVRAGKLADSNLYARQISHVQFKTVATKEYLKKSPPLKKPKDLQLHNCIINNIGSMPKRWMYNFNGTNKTVKINGHVETNDSYCILSFVRQGLGVALLPERYVQNDLLSGSLVEVLSKFAPEPIPINLIYPSNKLMSATLRALIDALVLSFK